MSAALEIKLCGLTRPDEAASCAEAGADAIGVVFYAASPRHMEPAHAREIVRALPPGFPVVGVFADSPADTVARIAEESGLRIVQLHGREKPSTLSFLLARGFHVIKALNTLGDDLLRDAHALPPECGILVECGKGPLPGGNAATWNWAEAAPLAGVKPFAVAGGLTPDNIEQAVLAAHPSAVDLSSGVEDSPGRKNLEKTRRLVDNVRRIFITWPVAPVFRATCPKGEPPCPDNR
jgi:phosphoribosylanthranilate isomerase